MSFFTQSKSAFQAKVSIPGSEITPESVYHRRRFLKSGIKTGAILGMGMKADQRVIASVTEKNQVGRVDPSNEVTGVPLNHQKHSKYVSTEKDSLTDFESVTTYNNFYELGTAKSDPSDNAHWLKVNPWSVEITGAVNKPGKIDLDDIRDFNVEERVYRMRCVEAWSMVIPWLGIPLGDFLKRFEPTAKAKYVAFKSIHDPQNLIGQRQPVLNWPYQEGLTIAEAMHPLTMLSTGLYGRSLLEQNGAPLRLVVPWKYGFKSIKSIVSIHLQETRPLTSWNRAAPNEYGFYSNVNPAVRHPRWSQSRERRIGEVGKRKTQLFNGYPEVAELYQGLDLKKNF